MEIVLNICACEFIVFVYEVPYFPYFNQNKRARLVRMSVLLIGRASLFVCVEVKPIRLYHTGSVYQTTLLLSRRSSLSG